MVICQQCPDQDDSSEEDTTNVYSPLTLQKLASQKLLRDEALAISALKDLPIYLFPVMFEEAFTNRYTKMLKAMIPMWPLPYISLEMLINECNLETLKAMLEGLDILLEQKASTSRCKLRAINWTNAHHDLHQLWAGTHKDKDVPTLVTQRQPMEKSPDCEVKKELKVTTELHLIKGRLDESVTYLLQWAQQKKDSVHLCCRNLHIQGLSKARVIDVFKTVHAGCIQELILRCISMEELAFLNPYLTQMKSLFTLTLRQITSTFSMGDSERLEEEKIFSLSSQLPIFHCLQKLYINNVSFIQGNLKECLRCLKKPLKTLSITNCDLSQSDLDYLPYCLNIFELRRLQLLNLYLSDLFLEPLGFLLERVRDTLQTLELESCHIEDSQVNALLPALSQCSHLILVSFSDNNVSLLFLKQLLHHTAELSQLTHEQYPAPLECYDDSGVTLTYRLEIFAPELLDILRAKRQLDTVTFETAPCSKCGGFYVYDPDIERCFFVHTL